MERSYQADIDKCRELVLMHDVKGLHRAVDFVLATIQQQFHTVPDILRSWRQDATKAQTCWGMKADGYLHVRVHGDRLNALVQHAAYRRDPVDMIDTLLEIPGLNTVKAAFVAQLYGLEVGCLDTHNEVLYQTDAASFSVPQTLSAKLRLARIESYVDFCNRIGNSAQWWGNWCEFIAAKYPQRYDMAEDVSQQHINCLLPLG